MMPWGVDHTEDYKWALRWECEVTYDAVRRWSQNWEEDNPIKVLAVK